VRRATLLGLASLLLSVGCADDAAQFPKPRTCAARSGPIALVEVGNGFSALRTVVAPAGDRRLFVVEQTGKIWLIENAELHAEPFVDLTDLVGVATTDALGRDRGLLSVAFHPAYATNGRFFVSYTEVAGAAVIAEYHAGPTAAVADPTGVVLLTAPASNGSVLRFGPDGYLYVGVGDGGNNDRQGNSQTLTSLLGKVLRIDVDRGAPYAIPDTNPFANGGGDPTLVAWGLHRPLGLSFAFNSLWIADVGQNSIDEINRMQLDTLGANFGWPLLGGQTCLARTDECFVVSTTFPELLLDRLSADGCGFVPGEHYRGTCLPDLQGQYIAADACTGRVGSLVNSEVGIVLNSLLSDASEVRNQLAAIGTDGFGELYLVTRESGKVFRMQVE
jgi:glucose/arabinose dehydrogenase